MKVLFAMASAEYLRYYDGTIRLLASRGHDVVLAVNHDSGKKMVTLDGLAGECRPRVSVAGVLPAASSFWRPVSTGLRGTMDFIRYLDPRLAGAAALRARIRRKVLPRALHGLDRVKSAPATAIRLGLKTLSAVEAAIPTVGPLDTLLSTLGPDVVVVTPLVDAASPQVDLVKSARRRGTPVAAAIASWDNLTNKGLLRLQPDVVLVWNDIQKREAVTLHGAAPERVVVTGAQLFDRWFSSRPSRSADEFCRAVGFERATPFVLFTCSSGFISEGRSEVAFVRSWIQALRSSGHASIAGLPILVRPHPYNTRAWEDADLTDLGSVVVWPRGPYNPVADESREAFFDSLYYSSAVVGINTSAMIEAAIVGRPVLSIRAAEFASTQEGTLHFHYLLPENGGFLRVAQSLEQHVQQLADVLDRPAAVSDQLARFVETFIRPRGRGRDATPIVVETIEELARQRVRPRRDLAALPLRPLVWAIGAGASAVEASREAVARGRKNARLRLHRARKAMARFN